MEVEVEMDAAIWSRLPEKLVERIVAMLPLGSFMRLRGVCKHWYNLMFSDSFLEVCREVKKRRQGKPCFLLFKRGVWNEGFLYDPLSSSSSSSSSPWLRMGLPFLPPGFTVAASSGGLLCCVPDQPGCKTILMCNPLTQSLSLLPSTLKERFVPSVGLLVDNASQSYKLVVAGDDLISPFAVKNLSTEVFESVGGFPEWRISGALPRLCSLESGKMTYSDGYFYCMNYSPFSVLAYDVREGVWNKIEAPMRRFLRAPSLVECRGRLVLVAAVRKSKLNVPKSIRMWGLHHSRNGWVELERMPQHLYDQFIALSREDEDSFSCIAHGNLILITMARGPEMLMYDFYDKIWSWVPSCPFLDAGEGLQGFPFDPRFDASPSAMDERSAALLAPSFFTASQQF